VNPGFEASSEETKKTLDESDVLTPKDLTSFFYQIAAGMVSSASPHPWNPRGPRGRLRISGTRTPDSFENLRSLKRASYCILS
jgi:hypothetical protein